MTKGCSSFKKLETGNGRRDRIIPKRVGELVLAMGDFSVGSSEVGAADPFFLELANLGYRKRRSYRRMGKISVQSLQTKHQTMVFIEVLGIRPSVATMRSSGNAGQWGQRILLNFMPFQFSVSIFIFQSNTAWQQTQNRSRWLRIPERYRFSGEKAREKCLGKTIYRSPEDLGGFLPPKNK